MAYRNAVNAQTDVSLSGLDECTNGFVTIDEALNAFQHQQDQQRRNNSMAKAHQIDGIAEDTFHHLHSELKSYWTQFGFLDKSTPTSFMHWASQHISIKEYKDFKMQANPVFMVDEP